MKQTRKTTQKRLAKIRLIRFSDLLTPQTYRKKIVLKKLDHKTVLVQLTNKKEINP